MRLTRSGINFDNCLDMTVDELEAWIEDALALEKEIARLSK